MRVAGILLAVAVLLAACSGGEADGPVAEPQALGTSSPNFGCFGKAVPAVTPAIPADVAGLLSQQNANCLAWQEFIGLNWAADTSTCSADTTVQPSQFGEPGGTSPPAPMGPSVWETYQAASEVFLPEGAKPPAWCKASDESVTPMILSSISKFAGNDQLDLSDIGEAGTGGSWLTAQSGNLTFYAIHMNQDEFNYVYDLGLYDARTQQTVAASQGINLPDGSEKKYGTTGAIELKAAWLELDDPADWPRFKTSPATIFYPGQTQPKQAVVGLVGLHIIHKTQLAQQLIWATFEHVDNAPSEKDIAGKKVDPNAKFTYYNPKCTPATDPVYQCALNESPNPGPSPSPDPYDVPVQVARLTPLSNVPSDNVVALNQAVWGVIEKANPNSVFLNYQLVNVLWPNSSTIVPPGAPVPLPSGDPQPNPGSQPVANTTLETYLQSLTCMSCHASAPIASVKDLGPLKVLRQADAEESVSSPVAGATPTPTPSPRIGSDYSFLFNRAEASG